MSSESAATVVKPEVVFVEELLDEIITGRLRVPRFQRPYVWSPKDMLNLFDSIRNGYPIGSLLLWETPYKGESLDKFGPLSVPKKEGTSTFVLDGHQRLATLFGTLRLPLDFPKGPDENHWPWWIWYNLKKPEFLHVPKGTPTPYFLPVRAILKTMDFLEASVGSRVAS